MLFMPKITKNCNSVFQKCHIDVTSGLSDCPQVLPKRVLINLSKIMVITGKKFCHCEVLKVKEYAHLPYTPHSFG